MEQWIQQWAEELTPISGMFLLLAIASALSFEFVNGFHDTANAVATVIYTHSLKPVPAVIWSGLWNLMGVLTSSGMVAFSVVALLPAELVLNVGSGAGFAMVFALLISAICWNLGTWYLGLPTSSSHTLIGSIMGVGIANTLLTTGTGFGEGINWGKTQDVFVSLLTSPLIGFVGAALLLLIVKTLLPQPALYAEPEDENPPPYWIRALLILTCTGVSFAHGSNDGQKGMGLMMLILVGILPGLYALNLNLTPANVERIRTDTEAIVATWEAQVSVQPLSAGQVEQELSQFLQASGEINKDVFSAIRAKQKKMIEILEKNSDLTVLSRTEKIQLRSDIYLISASLSKLEKLHQLPDTVITEVQAYQHRLKTLTQFIPIWVKVAVAVALGFGTMVGWKRIVVTVGEKIGKDHLTYAQGASAELVAMSTIFAADRFGLPVSTTHVLASGIAGSMVANGSPIQGKTIRNILLAWVLTLPVCVLLGGVTFAAGLMLVRWLDLA